MPLNAEDWLRTQRREVAALLTQEPDIDHLSSQEADESTGRFLSYYEHDLVVVDWDAALIMDQAENFDETLYVMELANLQLAELEAYDRMLDEALVRSYRDLGERRARARSEVLRELRDIRIDLARFNDELSNITKFFGDWHLARVYLGARDRFYLDQWRTSVEQRLAQLDKLYSVAHSEMNEQRMLWLEIIIVIFFAIDLVILMRVEH